MGRKRGERLRARHRWDQVVGPSPREGAQGQPRVLSDGALLDPDASCGEIAHESETVAGEGASARAGGPRWALSAGLAAIVLCFSGLGAGLWWWSTASSPPEVGPVEPRDAALSGGRSSPQGDRPESPGVEAAAGREKDGVRTFVVHVAGAVVKPGVYRLPEGSRVHDAVSAAGGALPYGEPDRLNLAAQIEDGARIAVPRQGEALEAGAASSEPDRPAAGGSKVNLNTANAQELAQLPRVGPVLAQRIVDYREQHGRFSAPADLDAVPGIGSKMLESLLPLVSV